MRDNSYLLKPVPGCSLELAEAIINFRDNVTESHTTHSRRWSIWSLAGQHLDQSISISIYKYGISKPFGEDEFSSFAKNNSLSAADIHLTKLAKPFADTNFTHDIDLIRNVLLFCHTKNPKHIQTHFIAKKKYSKSSRAWHEPFCELCWRKSQASKELQSGAEYTNKSMIL